MIYLRAGVYAEGPTDYAFLLPLLDRLLDAIAAPLFRGDYEVAPTTGIDAPHITTGGRAARVATAIDAFWDTCTLFVIHTDGAGDPDGARKNNVEPGLAAARSAHPDRTIPGAACIPVREIEAWMLVDPAVFHALLGGSSAPACPAEPERDLDPKVTLRRILKEGGMRRPLERMHAFFGERVRVDALRQLPAFQAFEADLLSALREIARLHGTS